MAGKHWNYDVAGANTAQVVAAAAAKPPWFPGGKLDKAYAEGRKAGIDGVNPFTGNPFPSGSPQNSAWGRGHSAGFSSDGVLAGTEFQTGWPDKP